MRRKLSAWGWAGVGAVIVLWIAWLAVTVWTAVEEHHDHATITRIERVIGIGAAHGVGGHGVRPQPTGTVRTPPGPAEGGGASTGHSPHSPSGPSPGGPGHETDGATDTPSHPHGPSVAHQSPHGHKSGAREAPAAAPAPGPSSSIVEHTETVVVEPGAPKAEPPVTAAAGGLVESVGGTLEGAGTTVEETGYGLNEVVDGLGCLPTHSC